MCTAQTCIRSALAQAFRSPQRRISTALTIPEFLVPTAAASRRFSNTTRRRAEAFPVSPDPPTDHVFSLYRHRIASKQRIPWRIPIPHTKARGDVDAWVAAIEPFLPPHLRRSDLRDSDHVEPAMAIDLALFFIESQKSSADILSYLGLVQGRWEVVLWIIKKLVEDGPHVVKPPLQPEPLANVIWPYTDGQTIDDILQTPLVTQRVAPSRTLKCSLDEITSAPDSIVNYKRAARKRALGQVWRTLGSMILTAAEEQHTPDSHTMSHVLEIIAYLHHSGLIPDSVYTSQPIQDSFALQQPPTLHLLSSKILTALSDASWRAHEASVKVAQERMNASYFLGHEIPGSRYRVQVTEVAPELWLELVLWSCLHGGWMLDGTAILESILSQEENSRWKLVSWRELLQKSEEASPSSQSWRLFGQRAEAAASKAEDRARAHHTISSEIVTAFIDGLVNTMRLGVSHRGTDPDELVAHIKNLKQLLDINSLSLGSATWDAIIIRLLDSGGLAPEKRPELLLRIAGLASGFGSEVASANAPSRTAGPNEALPYFFEPSAVPISILHRTLRSFVNNGGISGAMATLNELQALTDRNKQRSLEQFFDSLKQTSIRSNRLFTGPPIDFPAFDLQIPVPLLAKLLDLTTEAKLYDLGRWFLLAEQLDGPVIDPKMYTDWDMAAAIIRFGTLAGEHDLVLKIVKSIGTWNEGLQTQRLPLPIITALLCSQIQVHRWESVGNMQGYVLENPNYRAQTVVFSTFAAEIMRAYKSTDKKDREAAQTAFRSLLFDWESIIMFHRRHQLYSILAIMSTMDSDLSIFSSQFLPFSTHQRVRLSTKDFNTVLGGVLDGFGSQRGQEVVDSWCYKPPNAFGSYRSPGGVKTMTRYRPRNSREYEDQPEDIEITQPSGIKFTLEGRIYPNRQTIWAVLRKVQLEEDERRANGIELLGKAQKQVHKTVKWAANMLYYLGFDYEDIVEDLGSLAELAELEGLRPAGNITGLEEEIQDLEG